MSYTLRGSLKRLEEEARRMPPSPEANCFFLLGRILKEMSEALAIDMDHEIKADEG